MSSKRKVFVVMPFSSELDDVYTRGIKLRLIRFGGRFRYAA